MQIANFLVWRAFLLVVLGLLFLNFAVVFHKIKLFIIGVIYFVLCNDKSWKKPSDEQAVFRDLMQTEEGRGKIKRKTIVFVRHGESLWNDTFNKGAHRSALSFAVGFLPSLVKAFLCEFYLLFAGKLDSWFYDSPLSHLGLNQVKQLSHFLHTSPVKESKEDSIIRIMRGDKEAPPSKLVSSNLRRAISTMAAAFHDRLQKTPSDSILILPSLQEISRNPDTLSLSLPFSPILASWIEKQRRDVCDFESILAKRVDVSLNSGNKPVSTNGLKRMLEFCNTVFSSSIKEDYVVVGGHSIWFRSFFKTFLPSTSMHVSKRRKIVNAGCVSFSLMTAEVGGKKHYMIDESSIQVIYGGF